MSRTATHAACARAAAAQRVERRDAGAHQRRRLLRRKTVRHPRQRPDTADEVIRVAAVGGHARDRLVLTVDQVAAPARVAVAAVAAEPADADPLADVPPAHAVADRVDDTCDFVSGYNRKRHAGEVPVLRVRVAVADTAGLHLDANFPWSRLRSLPLVQLERATGL